MCGLIYAKRRDNRSAVKSLLKRFEQQKGRGTQGFGYIVIKNGVIHDIKRAKFESHIKEFLKEDNDAHEILFHHRFPTSTINLEEMTHPIVVKNDLLEYDYYVIHNGVLTNEDELKKEYDKMGFVYTTAIKKKTVVEVAGRTIVEEEEDGFNDSESFAIDLALYLDDKKNTIDSRGSIAFICLQTYKDGRVKSIHYGRNEGNPLVVEDNGDLLFLKSSGSGEDIEENTLFTIDYATGNLSSKEVKIGSRYVNWAGFGRNTETTYLPTPEEYEHKKKDVSHTAYDENAYDDTFDDRSLQNVYTQTNITKQRYAEIKEEMFECEAEIRYAEEQLADQSNKDIEFRKLLIEELTDSRKKLAKLNEEYEFLDDWFGNGKAITIT